MANEKLVSKNVLKAFREANDKRLKDGVVVPAKSLTAEQLENVSDESGAYQTNPFLFQATGTDNNTTETPTAPIAKHLELRGNTIKFNQLCKNLNGWDTTNGGWYNSTANSTRSFSDGVLTVTIGENATAQLFASYVTGYFYDDTIGYHFVVGHKYLIRAKVKTSKEVGMSIKQSHYGNYITCNNDKFTNVYDIYTCDTSYPYVDIISAPRSLEIGDTLTIKELEIFDLTEMFGVGKEPTTLLSFNRSLTLPFYAYNGGELVSCKSSKLITTGMNQCDQDLVQGGYNTDGTVNNANLNACRDNNYIKVIAGQSYSFAEESELEISGYNFFVVEYDENKNFIRRKSADAVNKIGKFTITENTHYVRICCFYTTADISAYISTIKFAFYLTWDESRSGYEPYWKKEYVLPNVELRSVGDVYDVITPDGTHITNIAKLEVGQTEIASLTNLPSYGENFFSIDLPIYGKEDGEALFNKNGLHTLGNVYNTPTNAGYYYTYVGKLYFNLGTSDTTEITNFLTGLVIQYIRRIQAQEQVASFSENIEVDDFGTMQFVYSGTNDVEVPQGNKFFYPADYVLFIDDLYNKIEGDVGELLNKEDVVEIGDEHYAKKNGEYPNLYSGNVIPTQKWRWVNDFKFGTGTVPTVFSGTAKLYSVHGKTEWSEVYNPAPTNVYVEFLLSLVYNLYIAPLGLPTHVVKSDDFNNGLVVWGTGVEVGTIMEFSTSSDFSSITEIALTQATNSMGETYLHCTVPNDGYIRFKSGVIADGGIANVFNGSRVLQHQQVQSSQIYINSTTYFPNGMLDITLDDEVVCYDELMEDRYYARVKQHQFHNTPNVTYYRTSGTFNIYYYILSNAMEKGHCYIAPPYQSTPRFKWLDVGVLTNTTPISEDSMSLGNGFIFFAISQSEDTTYTYSEDTAVVDQASFETQSAVHTLYTLVDGEYVEATEYVSGTTYYYVSATNTRGLNGKVINDYIAQRYINYQVASMDKTIYTGTAISPALNWEYQMGEYGTEELEANNYGVTPDWEVYYPVDIRNAVQSLPQNYISKESCEKLLHQIGEQQGFNFSSIDYDNETGTMKVNGLVDTSITILEFDSHPNYVANYWSTTEPISDHDRDILVELFGKNATGFKSMEGERYAKYKNTWIKVVMSTGDTIYFKIPMFNRMSANVLLWGECNSPISDNYGFKVTMRWNSYDANLNKIAISK